MGQDGSLSIIVLRLSEKVEKTMGVTEKKKQWIKGFVGWGRLSRDRGQCGEIPDVIGSEGTVLTMSSALSSISHYCSP